MEITIKTLDQIQEGRVTIEVRGERLYTAAQVGDAQASEAELVSAPLRRRIETLEEEASLGRRQLLTLGQELIGERERADKLNERNAELVAKLARVEKGHVCVETCRPNAHVAFQGRERVQELEMDLAQSEVARTEAERKLADAERAIEILSGQLGRISGAVHSAEMVKAMNPMYRSPETVTLAEAIRAVRDALGSPSPPGSPKPVTSQA